MALERLPDGEPEYIRGGNAGIGSFLPDDIESCMDKIFKYTLRRGLLIMLFLHPFFKMLFLMLTYEVEERAQLDIPIMPRRLRFLFPFKVKLYFTNNELAFSIHLFWGWLESIYRRLLPSSNVDPSNPRLLSILQALFTGQRIRRIDLRSASKPQMRLLVAFAAFIPVFFTLFFTLIFFPFTRSIGMIIRSFSVTLKTALRPVPALLAILVIMFVTGDAWRMFGLQPMPRVIMLIIFVMSFSLVALSVAMRTPDAGWRTLLGRRSERTNILHSWAEKTPASRLIALNVTPILPLSDVETDKSEDSYEIPQLAENVTLIYIATAIMHVIAIALWVSATFIIIGIVAVSSTMTDKLSDTPANILLHFSLFGQDFILSRQLVLLSVALGCIAALTFATSTLQSAEGRAAFIDYATLDLRRALGALSYYVGMLMALLLILRKMGVFDELSSVGRDSLAKLLDLLKRLSTAAA
jgi:hypothetical protein